MKKNRIVISIMILALLFASGCDTGSSAGDDKTDTTPTTTETPAATTPSTPTSPTTPTTETTIPTIDSLVGTWEYVLCDTDDDGETDTRTKMMTITKTGPTTATFIMTSTSVEKDSAGAITDTEYSGQKGTISLSADGIMTKLALEVYDDVTPPPDPSDTWDDGEGWTEEGPISFINSVLYFGTYSRQGSGSGLIGTWEKLTYVYDYVDEYDRTTLTIANSTIEYLNEESYDGITYTEDSSGTDTYTDTGTALRITRSGGTADLAYYLSGDCLYVANKGETSTTNFGWVKR